MRKRSDINTSTNISAIDHAIRFDVAGITNLGIFDDTARFDIDVVTQGTVTFKYHINVNKHILTSG